MSSNSGNFPVNYFTWNPSKFLDDELLESPGDDEFIEFGVIGEYGKPGGVDSICVLNIVGFEIPKMSEVDIASPVNKN